MSEGEVIRKIESNTDEIKVRIQQSRPLDSQLSISSEHCSGSALMSLLSSIVPFNTDIL